LFDHSATNGRTVSAPHLGRLRRAARYVIGLPFGIAFVFLGYLVRARRTDPYDQRALHTLVARTATWPHRLVGDLSLLGSQVFLLSMNLGILLLLLARRRWADALLLIGAMAGWVALGGIAKDVVSRPPPGSTFQITGASASALPSGYLPRVPQHDGSFPSGHTLGITCLALVLLHFLWRSGGGRWMKIAGSVTVIAAVTVVGASLLIVGGHYPTDILGSVLLGVAWTASLLALSAIRAERQRKTGENVGIIGGDDQAAPAG